MTAIPTSTRALSPTFGCLIESQAPGVAPDRDEVLARFNEQGAVILRGFPFTKDSFVAFSDSCCASFSAYIGGGFRFRALDREAKDASGTVMTTTGSTQSFGIPLHGEMFYLVDRPDVLWFYCAAAPARKGQTTVADGAEIFARLSDASKDFFRARGLMYVRELSAADWPTTFQTSDPVELKRLCDANNMTLEMRPDGSIRTEFVTTATSTIGGRDVFINNALMLWTFEAGFRAGLAKDMLGDDLKQLPLVARAGDGSELPEAVMKDLEEVCDSLTVEITWQTGDVVMVDNRRILHGRRKTGGEAREILVRLGRLLPNAVA
jgi:alpha-ketoglutarate-dependent taurine dioxygenase